MFESRRRRLFMAMLGVTIPISIDVAGSGLVEEQLRQAIEDAFHRDLTNREELFTMASQSPWMS